jgi:Ca2+/Na+ antiporter
MIKLWKNMFLISIITFSLETLLFITEILWINNVNIITLIWVISWCVCSIVFYLKWKKEIKTEKKEKFINNLNNLKSV